MTDPTRPDLDAIRQRLSARNNNGGELLAAAFYKRDVETLLAHVTALTAERDELFTECIESDKQADQELIAQYQTSEGWCKRAEAAEAQVLHLTQQLAEASSTLDKVVAADPEKSLAQRIRDEFADFQMVISHCTTVYMHFSRDRISKVNTLPDEVIRLAEDFESEDIREAIKEEIVDLKQQLQAAEATGTALRAAIRSAIGTLEFELNTPNDIWADHVREVIRRLAAAFTAGVSAPPDREHTR